MTKPASPTKAPAAAPEYDDAFTALAFELNIKKRILKKPVVEAVAPVVARQRQRQRQRQVA